MNFRITSLAVIMVIGFGVAKAIEPEPNWSIRFEELNRDALFIAPKPPKVGSHVSILPRVGSPITGKLEAVGRNTVTVDGKTINTNVMATQTIDIYFPDIAAKKAAAQQVRKERQDYLSRKTAEEMAFERQRIQGQQKQAEEESKRAEEARKAEEQTHLDFKGLRLGMTSDQINWLRAETDWEYRFPPRQQSKYVFLTSKEGAPLEFRAIGCKGPEGEKRCFGWENAYVQFFNGRVYCIGVMTSEFSADEIDSELKAWLHMAYQAVTNKYGEPDEVLLEINKINIFSFKSGFDVAICKWIRNEQEVSLRISENDSQFIGSIYYLDLNVQKTLDEQTTTETSI